jgi:ribonuclease HI
MPKYVLATDGAAKGTRAPPASGSCSNRDGEDEPVAAIGESIGTATNNVAEYRALLRGLNEALLRGASEIEVRTDSELMARQIQGRYRVTSPQLLPLHAEARSLLSRFEKSRITHVLRGKNALADKLANQGVAGAQGKKAPAEPATRKPAKATFRHTHSHEEGAERLTWNVERLWELAKDLPVEAVPLASVEAILDEDCWFGGKVPTLRDVAKHARRIYEGPTSRTRSSWPHPGA